MPRLLLFAPCEKVIVDQNSNTISLISILQDFAVHVPPNVEVSEKAQVPFRWRALAIWHKQGEDEGKRFEQEVIFINPEGRSVGSATSFFEMSRPYHRTVADFPGFPISIFGLYEVKLYFREDREGEEKVEVASFPFSISRSSIEDGEA